MRRAQKDRQFGIMALLRRLGLAKKKKALPVARKLDPDEEESYEAPAESSHNADLSAAATASWEASQQTESAIVSEPPEPPRQPAAESLRAIRAESLPQVSPQSESAPPELASTEFSVANAAEQLLARHRRTSSEAEDREALPAVPAPAAQEPPPIRVEPQPAPAPANSEAGAPVPVVVVATPAPDAKPSVAPGKSKPMPVKLAAKVATVATKAPSGGAGILLDDPAAASEGAAEEDTLHWFQRYWRRVGAGSLALSIAVHVVALIIAVLIVTTTATHQTVDFLPGGGSKGAGEASAEVAHQVQAKRHKFINEAPKQRVVSASTLSTVKLPDLPLDKPEMPPVSNLFASNNNSMGMGQAGSGGGFGNGIGIGGQSGFANLPPMLRSRCGNMERLSKLKESGGTPECEAAVGRALQWLKSQQHPDGSWGGTYKCAMTGFALLCYLGHCETPDSPAYGSQVMKGLLYLTEMQRKNRYGVFSTNPASNASTYEHGICTYAFGEMYTLARLGNRQLPGMREAFEDGVKVIIENQMPSGAWSYGSGRGIGYDKDSRDPDLSVTGWQYQALKAARYTGLPIRGLNSAIDKAVKYIESTQTREGGFGLRERMQGYNQWNLTGVAVLGLQTLGHGSDRAAIEKGIKFSVDFFANEPPQWSKNANLYCWYYYSQAFFQYGGPVWKGWNERLLPELLEHQAKDGSWNEETYNSDLASTSMAIGDAPIYRATLCTLMLEVYYRYLKVGDRQAGSVFDRR